MMDPSSYTEEELLQIQAIAEHAEAQAEPERKARTETRAYKRAEARRAKKANAVATMSGINAGLRPENGNAVNWFNERNAGR